MLLQPYTLKVLHPLDPYHPFFHSLYVFWRVFNRNQPRAIFKLVLTCIFELYFSTPFICFFNLYHAIMILSPSTRSDANVFLIAFSIFRIFFGLCDSSRIGDSESEPTFDAFLKPSKVVGLIIIIITCRTFLAIQIQSELRVRQAICVRNLRTITF